MKTADVCRPQSVGLEFESEVNKVLTYLIWVGFPDVDLLRSVQGLPSHGRGSFSFHMHKEVVSFRYAAEDVVSNEYHLNSTKSLSRSSQLRTFYMGGKGPVHS